MYEFFTYKLWYGSLGWTVALASCLWAGNQSQGASGSVEEGLGLIAEIVGGALVPLVFGSLIALIIRKFKINNSPPSITYTKSIYLTALVSGVLMIFAGNG